jgi:hypothetical protein
MNIAARLFLVLALAAPLAACKKEEAPKVVEKAPIAAPKNEDAAAWRAYITDVVTRNMEGVSGQPFVYMLPAESSAEFEGSYDRLLDKASTDISRGIMAGSMLAYASASPSSTKAADMVVTAFEAQKVDGKLKGVKLVFIGKPEDSERVKAAVTASGVNYVFIEAK